MMQNECDVVKSVWSIATEDEDAVVVALSRGCCG